MPHRAGFVATHRLREYCAEISQPPNDESGGLGQTALPADFAESICFTTNYRMPDTYFNKQQMRIENALVD